VAPSAHLKLQLHEADFTTATRIAEVVNRHFAMAGLAVARAENSAVVAVDVPASFASRPVEFVAEMENLTVESSHREKIVINERTGTITLGKDARIAPVTIMHGALSVEIQTTFNVSQPAPLAGGTTVITPETNLTVKENRAKNIVLKDGATVEELVRALQAIGSTPRDVIAILQNMRAAGALEAEIEVI
jgi:flagellar P-ring protein precursor FlgI